MLKYQISVTMPTILTLHFGTTIRFAGTQASHSVTLWAEVPDRYDSQMDVERTFRVIGTGHDVPSPGTYLGTVFDDPFVWHVYEVTS